MRKPKEPTAEERAQYVHDLAEAHAALEGVVQPRLDAAAQKACISLVSANCDAIVSKQGFLVQYEGGRRLIDYIPGVAPTVLHHLVRWAGANTPCSELLAVPITPQAPKLPLAPELRTFGKRLVWLRARYEIIRFALRFDAEPLRAAAWPAPVAASRSPAPVYRALDPQRPCPHCGVALSRVRDLSYAMICSQCGRSFTSWDASNPNPRR